MKRLFACTLLGLCTTSLAFADVSLVERRNLRQSLAAKNAKEKPEHARRAGAGKSFAAAPAIGSQQLIDSSGLEYFLNTNVTFSTSSSASGAASEASYTGPVSATTSGGGTVSTTLTDAFEGYNALCISLDGFTGSCGVDVPQLGGVVVAYNQNGPATTECNGRQLVLPEMTVGPFLVSRKVFVPANDEFARWLNVVTNAGAVPRSITLFTSNNLGSDEDTVVVSTSDGDATAEPADTWVTTFENFTGTTSSDPRLGHVLQGPGAPVQLAEVSFSDGDDNPFWAYTFTVNPGQTAIIANFVTGQPSRAEANAKAAELAGLPATAVQCLTPAERSQIVNFSAELPVDITVPTVSEIGLMALGLGLLGSALVILRRR